MTTYTPRLTLPFIEAAQAQKHVTHNAALERLDVVVQLRVQRCDATIPPDTPIEGHAYALGDTPTGDWAGQGGRIASFEGGGWLFVSPDPGWRAWDTQRATLKVFHGGAWQPAALGPQDLNDLPRVGINASADDTNRLTVAAEAALFTHAGSNHRITVNKATATDTASLLYQAGFSGRAEMGLAGSDDFGIKVSSDGSTWKQALSVDAASGGVALHQFAQLVPGAAPAAPARGTVYYDNAGNVLRCWDGTVWRELF